MINLLTKKQKKTIHHIRILRIWISIVMGTVSLIGISLILFFPTLLIINNKYTSAQEDQKKVESTSLITPESLTQLTKRVSETETVFAVPEHQSTLTHVEVIYEKKTPGITISRITNTSRENRTLEIAGIASTRTILAGYEASLREDPRIQKVESPVSNYVKTQDTVFILKIQFK